MATLRKYLISGLILFGLIAFHPCTLRAEGSLYAIELRASLKPIQASGYPVNHHQEAFTLYTSIQQQKDQKWHQLRVGFFTSHAHALRVANQRFRTTFPDLWIVQVSAAEVTAIRSPTVKRPLNKNGLTREQLQQLLHHGERAMAQENYSKAALNYQQVLKSGDRELLEEAQFNLALAYELGGTLHKAKTAYEAYLSNYGNRPKASEAKERLDNLLGVNNPKGTTPQPTALAVQQIKVVDTPAPRPLTHRSDVSRVQVVSTSTSIDSTWHLPDRSGQIKSVILGNFASGAADEWDESTRLSILYLDTNHRKHNLWARWGRQTTAGGGILGTFDGARLSYRLNNRLRLNLTTGFPVNSAFERAEIDTYFYGLSTDIGRLSEHWDLHGFIIHQAREGVTDRQAAGGEVRYTEGQGSLKTVVDYDLLFQDLNLLSLGADWQFPNQKTRLNLTAERRQNQTLQMSNALIGQSTTSLGALERSLDNKDIRQLALDRTRNEQRIKLSLTHPVTKRVELIGDVSWSLLEGAPASGGVDAIVSDGHGVTYSAQVVGSNLARPGDITVLQLRYGTTGPRDHYTLGLNTRYPLRDRWRINPKVQFDYQRNNLQPGTEWRLNPSLGFERSLTKRWQFNLESGVHIGNTALNDTEDGIWRYFFSVGLRRQL